jgi:hypothetical protein
MIFGRSHMVLGLVCLALFTGCGPDTQGSLGRERLFVPLLGFAGAHLSLSLPDQDQSGGLLIKYLDFSGRRVAMEVIPLPNRRHGWAWDLGWGAEKNGRPFYALKVERFGDRSQPVSYTFRRLTWDRSPKRGFIDQPGPDNS